MAKTWQLPQNDSKNSNKTIFKNATILDPYSDTQIIGDLIVENGIIQDWGNNIASNIVDGEIIECNNMLLVPGLIDMQVHFRDPGQLHKEDIFTGSKSAAAGGITTVVCQPNTSPVIDNQKVVSYIQDKALRESYIDIKMYGAISKGMKGEELSEMNKLAAQGVVGFTDDGLPVMNSFLMRQAFLHARTLDLPIVQHAEDLYLSNKGAINQGPIAFKLGVKGISNISESVIVARDIEILKETGGHYHVLHVSTKEALSHIRRAKAEGLNVTCEVAPHHFLLTDEMVLSHGTNAKMNPPLRSEADRVAMIEGLIDGTVDAIATDHAPHDLVSKNQPLEQASFGIVGVETMLPLSLELYHNKTLSLPKLMKLMTSGPANILKLPCGQIKKNMIANLTLIDLNKDWVIHSNDFSSKSKNSPFDGRKVRGKAVITMYKGCVVYRDMI